MHFTDIFIRRPVLATVLTLIVVLIGIRAYFALPVRQFPEVSASVVSITTTYSGASAAIMEGFVTAPLENSLAGINGIDYIQSSNTSGQSNITIHFRLGYDINKAITDIGNAVSSVRYLLPSQINDPVIAKSDPNADPTMFIPFLSTGLSPEQVTDYLVRIVQPQLGTLPGVSQALIWGQQNYSMRIWLNPQEMAALGITATDIQNALANNNIQTAAGYYDSQWEEFDITAKTDLTTADQFNNLVLKNINGTFIRLKDVGYAVLGPETSRVSAIINDKPAIVVAIVPQATANPIDVSKEVNDVLPSILKSLPSNLTGKVMYDTSLFIKASIHEVFHTVGEAILFVILVIFLFLGSFRSVLIPITTIPVSIIGVCGLMYAMGYSINTLTLLAWVLAIGLVVDDAIVVVENIHRHIEEGMSSFDAAIHGTRQIGFAVIAMTLTLAAVFAPIGFQGGLTGSLFREFAFTLAGAVIISGFVALTLSPMMCSKLLKKHSGTPGLAEKIDNILEHITNAYKNLLSRLLNRKKIVLIVASIIYLICYILFNSLPNELAPDEDQSVILAAASGPSSANLNYTSFYTQQLAEIYKKNIPEMIGYGSINGFGMTQAVNQAFSFVVLKPWSERKRSVQQIIGEIFPQFFGITGINAFAFSPPTLPTSSGFTPIEFVLKTTASYEDLNTAAQKLVETAKTQNPALLNIDSDLKLDKPQVSIDIDRNKAADLGISMNDINTTLNTAYAQATATHFNINGRTYDVIPQLQPQFTNNINSLNNLNLRTANGQLVPLSTIATINQTVEPQSLNHFQQLRSATITAMLAPGYTIGEGLNYLIKTSHDLLPNDIQYDFSGQSRQFMQEQGTFAETITFAIIFIFLVLVAQFESFLDPLIIIMSVPLSIAGALATLHLLPGATLNIYTKIGLVTLVGLITKHGILIVEFSHQLQEQGRERVQAVIEATSIRLRPILMTTSAMILGALPLAFSTGAGANSRSQIGWVIIGGMSFGTLFTLFIIPTVYLSLYKLYDLFHKNHQ